MIMVINWIYVYKLIKIPRKFTYIEHDFFIFPLLAVMPGTFMCLASYGETNSSEQGVTTTSTPPQVYSRLQIEQSCSHFPPCLISLPEVHFWQNYCFWAGPKLCPSPHPRSPSHVVPYWLRCEGQLCFIVYDIYLMTHSS